MISLHQKSTTMFYKKMLLAALAAALIYGCAKVPITNRKQMNLIPDAEINSAAVKEYGTFIKENPPVVASDPNAQMVKNIGGKISKATIQFLNQNKMSDRVAGYKWEFNLVNEKEANAWCMPGGKVVVYTGILPITKDETGLAFVMGHEIAHAVAKHGNERMSQMLLAQTGSLALDVALAQKPAETRQMYQTAYAIGAQYGALLPFSRTHESEADKLGMVFMAMAGYDPRQAPEVWKRMAAMGGSKPPEFMSTHPSDSRRMSDMKKFMAEAMKYYKVK